LPSVVAAPKSPFLDIASTDARKAGAVRLTAEHVEDGVFTRGLGGKAPPHGFARAERGDGFPEFLANAGRARAADFIVGIDARADNGRVADPAGALPARPLVEDPATTCPGSSIPSMVTVSP